MDQLVKYMWGFIEHTDLLVNFRQGFIEHMDLLVSYFIDMVIKLQANCKLVEAIVDIQDYN